MPTAQTKPKKTAARPAKAAPARPSARKAAPARPAGAGSATRVTNLEAAVKELTSRFDTLLWLYVEKEVQGRREAAKLLMAQPQVQDALVNGPPEIKKQILDKLAELTS